LAADNIQNPNAVEAALLFNDKKFPPLLPRKLRVSRAKSIKRNAKSGGDHPTNRSVRDRQGMSFAPKMSAEERSMQGRAGKLLGRAGAAQLRRGGGPGNGLAQSIRKPENFVFEGHRASSKQGNSGLKLGKAGGKKKGISRSRKRAQAWKAGGGK
jgi:nucleolar protein 12